MTIEGATDNEVFRTFFQRVLSPALRLGDAVIVGQPLPPYGGGSTADREFIPSRFGLTCRIYCNVLDRALF
jgi:hypothetical protein